MANMYFAKFNLSSNIHQVYREKDLKMEILKKIIAYVSQDKSIKDVYGTDYKFCNLEKNADDMYIAGRLVKIYKGEVETYNPDDDSTISTPQDNLANSITFYFDVLHEEIAFCSKRGFSNSDFIDKFRLLIEMFVPNLEFEIILEQNFSEFEAIVNSIDKVLKAKLTLIPPNDPNYDEFKAIFGRSFEEIEETKSTKYVQEIQVSKKSEETIQTNTKFFKNSYYAIGKGYGKMDVTDYNGHTISSEDKAPYKEYIDQDKRDIVREVIEAGSRHIARLLSVKSRLKLNGQVQEQEGNK